MVYRSLVLSLMTWNILHGGGANRMPAITLAIVERRPDIVALTEFRSTVGGQICGVLSDHGYSYQHTTPLSRRRNGILIASRHPIDLLNTAPPGDLWSNRWLEVGIPEFALRIAAVHVPDDTMIRPKLEYWHHLLAYARRYVETRCLVLGDFNSGRSRLDAERGRFACEDLLGTFNSIGFRDAFRLRHPHVREYSWHSHKGHGFRIDGAYVSPLLWSHVAAATYAHEERESGHSDHSPFCLELSLKPRQSSPKPPENALFSRAD